MKYTEHPILIHLHKRVIKIRGFDDRNAIVLPLREIYEKYIGNDEAEPKCCTLWLEDNIILYDVTIGYIECGKIMIKKLTENLNEVP